MSSTKKENEKRPRKSKRTTCGQCGSDALKVRRENEHFTYGTGDRAKELSATVLVYTCEKCGYEFLGSEAEAAYHEAVCKHLHVMPPKQVKEVRKGHGFSRSEFSRLTRLGPATLGRWERGALIQNSAYDQYLYLLRWKENVNRLKNRKWAHESVAPEAEPLEPCSQNVASLQEIETAQTRLVCDPRYTKLRQDWRVANFCQNEEMARRAYREIAYMEAEGPDYGTEEHRTMADEELFDLLERQDQDDPRSYEIERILNERNVLPLAR